MRRSFNNGRWTKEEHDAFLQGLVLHGKNWDLIAPIVRTRSAVQVRTHGQKYFKKVDKGERFPEEPYESMFIKARHQTLSSASAAPMPSPFVASGGRRQQQQQQQQQQRHQPRHQQQDEEDAIFFALGETRQEERQQGAASLQTVAAAGTGFRMARPTSSLSSSGTCRGAYACGPGGVGGGSGSGGGSLATLSPSVASSSYTPPGDSSNAEINPRAGYFVTYPDGSAPNSHGAMHTFASSSPFLCAPGADHGFFAADGFPGSEEAGGSGAGVSGGFGGGGGGGGGGQNWASTVRGSECTDGSYQSHISWCSSPQSPLPSPYIMSSSSLGSVGPPPAAPAAGGGGGGLNLLGGGKCGSGSTQQMQHLLQQQQQQQQQQQRQQEHHMPGFSEGVWYRQQQGPQTLPQEGFGQVDDWLNSPYLLEEDEIGGGHDPDGAVEGAARNTATDVDNLGIL